MRAPAIAGRDHERLRTILHGFVRSILMDRAGSGDVGPCVIEDEPAHERAVVQGDLLRRDQLAERVIR